MCSSFAVFLLVVFFYLLTNANSVQLLGLIIAGLAIWFFGKIAKRVLTPSPGFTLDLFQVLIVTMATSAVFVIGLCLFIVGR